MEDIRKNGRILSAALQKVTLKAVKKGKMFKANSIIVATTATIGEHALVTVPFLANQRFTCLTLKDSFEDLYSIKFLFYYCYKLGQFCLKNTNEGGFASVNMDAFNSFPFPLLPLEEQEKIVRKLDGFHKLMDSITEGLPAEIEARKKQYEYYRDKLLSFQPVKKP